MPKVKKLSGVEQEQAVQIFIHHPDSDFVIKIQKQYFKIYSEPGSHAAPLFL